jgi:F420-non-reducing hydrogenase small subunit
MKPKFLVASLSACTGCIGTLFALDIFPEFLEEIELVYFPFLMDHLDIQECDVALVEGCVADEKQANLLKEIRKNSKKLIALGTCAAFGGIVSLAADVTVEPISNYVEIDGFIPGCPTPPKLLRNCLMRLLENKELGLSEKNQCSTCPLRGKAISYTNQIKSLIPESITEERTTCFLEDGILCLGPVTREGCENKCIEYGMPCEGCLGPISQDFTSRTINFLSMINLSRDLRKYTGIFYRFAKPNIKRAKL